MIVTGEHYVGDELYTPTNQLRFIERGGQRILQQLWSVTIEKWLIHGERREWCDVPIGGKE